MPSQIHTGIQNYKVVILVLSPDSASSPNMMEEIHQAQTLRKTIIPILYRPTPMTEELAALVGETQYLDLSLRSYADNFQKLVDGLISAGVAQQTVERPLMFQPVKTDWNAVLVKISGQCM